MRHRRSESYLFEGSHTRLRSDIFWQRLHRLVLTPARDGTTVCMMTLVDNFQVSGNRKNRTKTTFFPREGLNLEADSQSVIMTQRHQCSHGPGGKGIFPGHPSAMQHCNLYKEPGCMKAVRPELTRGDRKGISGNRKTVEARW